MNNSRIIKFRAWNKETRIMIDLYKITPLALSDTFNGDGLFLPFRDKLVLMQFTGLYDRHGKEIYEGDILQWDNGYDHCAYRSVVEFEDGKFISKRERIGIKEEIKEYSESGTAYDFIVVGNIYENPELAEGNK